MYKEIIEYYTGLIHKFEEWIKYLKNGGNSKLVECFLEREGIKGGEDINYNTRPSSNRITNLKVTQTFIEEEDGKLKEVEKTQQIKAITAHSTLIGLDNEIDGGEVVGVYRRRAVTKYYELIDTIKEYKEEAQREQERKKIQEEAQNDKEIEFLKPYLNKLIDSPSYRGWCKLKDGIYIWDKCRGGKTNLAIFLIVIYREIKHTNIPVKFLGGYFGIKNISQIVTPIERDDKRVNDLKEYLKKD